MYGYIHKCIVDRFAYVGHEVQGSGRQGMMSPSPASEPWSSMAARAGSTHTLPCKQILHSVKLTFEVAALHKIKGPSIRFHVNLGDGSQVGPVRSIHNHWYS